MASPFNLKLQTQTLSVQYGSVHALTLESFVTRGNIIAIIGHNGSGKSTLLKSTLQLTPTQAGSLSAFFQDSRLAPERDMFFSPENGAVFADIHVQSYMTLWCRLKRRSLREPKARELLDRLDLYPLMNRLGRELSKGQRRRVQTAIGFLFQPRLLVFDEPFDGLDVEQSQVLSDLMLEHSGQTASILASHRMDVVERLADQVIVLDQGRLLTVGSPAEVARSLQPIQDLTNENGKMPTLADSLHSYLRRTFQERHAKIAESLPA